ncbi:hypothetical protein OG730_42365 (plasmid) [Streptomyces sp. NBC_01298]|uniref:hypothetical protein n=1 Tax=Streptomyces sp. NBC_01298 TaxID=2903817 RepID=UPI002E0E18D6|nr:hypothetical protein OG730_42365 [Streptomyces sp. NBC_01298]
MASDFTSLQQAQEALDRMTAYLADLGTPAAAVQALLDNTDPGPCNDRRGGSFCQLDLGHPGHRHISVRPPAPGTKTETEWASSWSDHDTKKHGAYDHCFFLPALTSPAGQAHAELVDLPMVFICQPVTETLLYVHIRLGSNDKGLTSWLRRIGLNPDQAKRTRHGDYLARGQLHGARIALIAHAHSYR